MADEAWLVVGLGNPGDTYARNRHNVGFMVLEVLAGRAGARFKAHRAHADTIEGRLAGRRAILAKPRSYMNDSGGPVSALAKFFRVPAERLVVVHDDLDLPFATLRVKQGGGDGGHNGLRSITKSLGGGDYLRVRFGIGRPPGRLDPADFVLRDFAAGERAELGVVLESAADAVESLVGDGLATTQNRFNGSATAD